MWQRTCAVKGNSQFVECKRKTINPPSTFYEDVWWQTRLPFERAEWSTWKLELSYWLSSWRSVYTWYVINCTRKPWGSLSPSLLMTMGNKTILWQHWDKRWCSFPWVFSPCPRDLVSELCIWLRARIPNPCRQAVYPTNPTSQQSPANSRQYKTTTRQLIHQLLRKIKNKKDRPRERFFLFCFRQSGQVMGVTWSGVIRPQRCMDVWVYKAALLCWAGRTPPAESGQWIWWRRHQGWRRLGRPLRTLETSNSPGRSEWG